MKRWHIIVLILFISFGTVGLTTKEARWVDKVANFYGDRAGKRVTAWRNMVENSQDVSELDKLDRVNDFFNQLYFVDDIDLWGQKDYWATPLEFLGAAAGDCEDFSIAKYFSLRELGIDDKKLRLVYVKAIRLDQFHMVVAYYPTPSSEPVLLDNLDPEIKRASLRRDLLPIYSFNGSRLWLMKERGQGELAGNASRLGLWNDLRTRVESLEMQKPIRQYDR
ncbi:sulfate adenylyltransferase [Salinivibrio sp. MA351]|jgi:predicted transglutaminase-like cysteine proteinase|uniref:Sulfate adenylyltransferase n=1 Tax=Salinivibrio costicola subsp. alcaliphilus TaxID=272773 RepID=A0ABX3KQS8_SALCS|nr:MULTISPECIES: transglutaminase-like cysteine peptidase [Salinivibrio]OOE92428.1 sulfate adenylyltransferase [Salinivibrio sp. AR647]OOE95320.1 sulfate adenylyltransferase [Salinivibrio sp. AR640]OOF00201.1 sulfate adenylyltransferase [Salinivibrio sp. MA351]OOF03887.1 sulfate adenylyltransferase [Salinivibrio sp. MA440]OOF12257.1 sulfate adenylyltransferase [Salinivibrio sp. MA427]